MVRRLPILPRPSARQADDSFSLTCRKDICSKEEVTKRDPAPQRKAKSRSLTVECPPLRLDEALKQVRASPEASKANFTLRFEPYQLFSDFAETKDKKQWYLETKHNNNPEAQKVFIDHMNSLVEPLGHTINFDGSIGNTLDAHRVIQHFQEEKGPDVANRLVDALYSRYFTQSQHPSSEETLIGACVEAGIDEEEARAFVVDHDAGKRSVVEKIRTVGMDVDAVPVIVFEGRRRDLTLTGAKEVAEYVKALQTTIKEST